MEQSEVFFKHLLTQLRKVQPIEFQKLDIIKFIDLDKDSINTIREELKSQDLTTVHSFWELSEYLYLHGMLPSCRQELVRYFISIQNNFVTQVSISYQLNFWKEFVLYAPNFRETAICLQTNHIEDQIQKLVNFLELSNFSTEDIYDFDYAFNFETKVETIFRQIAFDAWSEAKKQTHSTIQGNLSEYNCGSFRYDLDSKNQLKS